MKFVSIIIGSKSDYSVMRESAETLEKFGVPYELYHLFQVIESPREGPKELYLRGQKEKGGLQGLLLACLWELGWHQFFGLGACKAFLGLTNKKAL